MKNITSKINKNLILRSIGSLIALAIIALALTVLLQTRYFSDDFREALRFIYYFPNMFFFNAWLIFLILLILSGIFGSVFRAGGISAAVILIIGYIHINKFAARGTPLLPEDFQLATEAASLGSFVSIDSLVRLIIGVIAALLIGEILERWIGHYFISSHWSSKDKDTPFLKRHLFMPRLIAIFIGIILFSNETAFIIHHAGMRSEYIPKLNTTFIAWNQAQNYDANGFLVGFLYNWSKLTIAEPEGYGETAILSSKEQYERIAKAENQKRLSLADTDYNIVIILGESFTDPSTYESYYPHSGGDITPNLHRIMASHASGIMYSPDIGGGTANIEFEDVTGLTNYWINTVPYTNLIPYTDSVPSIANYARDNGYNTTAIHSYTGGMYKRNISLKHLGFTTFHDVSDLDQDLEANSSYLKDSTIYNKMLSILQNDSKQLILGITMQTHIPYDYENYDVHHFELERAPSGDTSRKRDIETYYESLHSADAYLGEFIDALDKSDQPTIVLFFGDHNLGIFDELNEAENGSPAHALSRNTPYFIYTNFSYDSSKAELPTTTPNCLVNTMLNNLNLSKPALGYLLDDVCTSTPILTPVYFGSTQPIWDESVKKYQLVTYDLLAGKQYWLKD